MIVQTLHSPEYFPNSMTDLAELPEEEIVFCRKGETSRCSIYHFFTNGFWQTSNRWSLPF